MLEANLKRSYLIVLIVIAALLVLFISLVSKKSYRKTTDNGVIYCATDVQACPDGSYVSRIPPECNFGTCEVSIVNGKLETELLTKIDQGASGLDVKVTPNEVLEDSRCPVDVTCIQAGTVRLSATLESGLGRTQQIFKLNTPITTEAEEVTLIKVLPEKYSNKVIELKDYQFIFKVRKR